MEEIEIKKVLIRKDGVKYIIIPKNTNINEGDYVKITKLKEEKDGRKS